MAALSVDKVFQFVQFVANKESRGWVSPAEFNIAAELAQIAVYSNREAMFLANKKIHSDMRPFLKSASVTDATPRAFPANFRQLISMRITSGNVPVPELTQPEYNDIANSSFLAPTDSYPFCVVRSDGIYVYPATQTGAATVEYIAGLSTVPTWAYTLVSARPVFNDAADVPFEFDEMLFMEIATNVLMHVGLNIDKDSVIKYGMAFNTQAA